MYMIADKCPNGFFQAKLTPKGGFRQFLEKLHPYKAVPEML
jgi:hypothetical protein